MNENTIKTKKKDVGEKPKLCYISFVAFFLAIFTAITPSSVNNLIALNTFTFMIAAFSW